MKPVNDAPAAELTPKELEDLVAAQRANRSRLGLPAETLPPTRPRLVPRSAPEPSRLDGVLRQHVEVPPMGDDVRIIDRVVYQRRVCACERVWWRARTSPNEACDECTAKVRREQRQLRHAAAVAAMPAEFQDATLALPRLRAMVGEEVLDIAGAAAAFSTSAIVLLLGATGTGKTTLASAIYRAQVDKLLAPGATVSDEAWVGRMMWAHAKPLSLARKESRLGATPRLLEQAVEASVLLLDDLGQDAPIDKDDIVDLLAFREANRRPTIITCGFPIADLETHYSPHLARRLHDRKVVIDLGDGEP